MGYKFRPKREGGLTAKYRATSLMQKKRMARWRKKKKNN